MPLKEFFSVLFDDIKNCLLISGNNSGFTFLHDLNELRNGHYKIFCSLVALALIMGCVGPRYFMHCVVSKLLDDSELIFTIDDVPDVDIQGKLYDILAAKDESSFKKAIELFPERFDFGVTQPHIPFEDRQEFIDRIIRHCCLSNCSDEMQEFIYGLNVLGLLSILKLHYQESRIEFVVCSLQKASDILKIYRIVEYTEKLEDNLGIKVLREAEEDIYYNWTNFLESLEKDGHKKMSVLRVDDDGMETDEDRTITLRDVMQFCTGSKFVLPSMERQNMFYTSW